MYMMFNEIMKKFHIMMGKSQKHKKIGIPNIYKHDRSLFWITIQVLQ